MKPHHFLLPASLLLLASCAATDPSSSPSAAADQLTLEERRYDIEWMERYEGLARRGGAKVYWVNKPRRDQ